MTHPENRNHEEWRAMLTQERGARLLAFVPESVDRDYFPERMAHILMRYQLYRPQGERESITARKRSFSRLDTAARGLRSALDALTDKQSRDLGSFFENEQFDSAAFWDGKPQQEPQLTLDNLHMLVGLLTSYTDMELSGLDTEKEHKANKTLPYGPREQLITDLLSFYSGAPDGQTPVLCYYNAAQDRFQGQLFELARETTQIFGLNAFHSDIALGTFIKRFLAQLSDT